MGGIKVDLGSRTSMKGLYACGETSCNGVHGKNRLASNSLLESLVFARRAADDIIFGRKPDPCRPGSRDLKPYAVSYTHLMDMMQTGEEFSAQWDIQAHSLIRKK